MLDLEQLVQLQTDPRMEEFKALWREYMDTRRGDAYVAAPFYDVVVGDRALKIVPPRFVDIRDQAHRETDPFQRSQLMALLRRLDTPGFDGRAAMSPPEILSSHQQGNDEEGSDTRPAYPARRRRRAVA